MTALTVTLLMSQVFLPAAALLAWLSCASCCFAKLRFRRPYPPHRKLCQVLPMGVAYLLDISPVAHRLYTCSWSSNSALQLHFLQVAPLLFTMQNMVFSMKGYFMLILQTKKISL